jgi:hypothetical protein
MPSLSGTGLRPQALTLGKELVQSMLSRRQPRLRHNAPFWGQHAQGKLVAPDPGSGTVNSILEPMQHATVRGLSGRGEGLWFHFPPLRQE